jgi:hypothetical protein
LPFPKVIDPEDPPLRPERRVPNSIATLRRRMIVKLVANLSRCPSAQRTIQHVHIVIFDAVQLAGWQ